jgi:hypothetical protein
VEGGGRVESEVDVCDPPEGTDVEGELGEEIISRALIAEDGEGDELDVGGGPT